MRFHYTNGREYHAPTIVGEGKCKNSSSYVGLDEVLERLEPRDLVFRLDIGDLFEGRVIELASGRSELPLERISGQRGAGVEARGKHLMWHLVNGHVIHSHMGMTAFESLPRKSRRQPARLSNMLEREKSCWTRLLDMAMAMAWPWLWPW